MFNQIRAEFYKLFHTKALYLTFALILAVFGIFSIGGQQQFVASSSSLDETWKIGETVGFLARAYSDTAHPLIEEIIRTATSYTVFFWLIVLIFSVIFFSREYTDSTIKIAIASGQSRIKFFVAKYIVISITSIFLYFSFIMIAFIIECAKFNIPTINEQISNFAQTYPTNLKASSNEALLFMRRYRFANCSCFSCCFKDAYPSSNVQ